jgi:hypothetical protein
MFRAETFVAFFCAKESDAKKRDQLTFGQKTIGKD